jgi:hypothetical protein
MMRPRRQVTAPRGQTIGHAQQQAGDERDADRDDALDGQPDHEHRSETRHARPGRDPFEDLHRRERRELETREAPEDA